MPPFKHTRLAGLCLTYEVALSPTRYVISLDGHVLKDALLLCAVGEGVDDDEVARAFAIEDIENLIGMTEQ